MTGIARLSQGVTTARPAHGRAGARRDLALAAALALTQLALAWWMRGFVTDDALITLRYARQWAFGHGITWNAGQDPVEGYTNFSQVALGALALRLDLLPLTTLRAVNALSGAGLVALGYLLGLRLTGARPWACAAGLLVGVHPALAYWSVSGLETSLYAFALLLSVLALETQRRWLACFVFLLAAITRFEGAFAALAVAGAYAGPEWLRTRRAALGRHLPWLALFCAAYAAYFVWRYQHFGYPLSNSAYYKTGDTDDTKLIRDFAYQAGPLLALLPLVPYRRTGSLGLALLLLIALYFAGYYDVMPSVAYLHRFFLPVYAPLALLGIAALHGLWQAPRARPAARAASALWLALALGWDLGNPQSGLSRTLYHANTKATRMVSRARVATFIGTNYPPSAVVAVQDAGMVGYALLNPILDTFGLNDEAFTHRFDRRRSDYVRWLLGKDPDVIVLVSRSTRVPYGAYATDRMIASDPRFARYRRAHVVASEVEPYHYMIYAREGLARRAPSSGAALAMPQDAELGPWLERVAFAIWSRQRDDNRETKR